MFPCSSIYQHVPMTNNNNNNNNNHPKPNHNSTAFQIGDYHHHHLYSSSSILLPSILEGVMLSHPNDDAHHHDMVSISSSSQEQHNSVVFKPPIGSSSSSSSYSMKQSSSVTTNTTTRSKNKRNKADDDNKKAKKKDRHSKICTAHGLRDRRMRLSLQIARKFFDLQDMLGFDKASRTIDWLFNKSKAAIKELKDSVDNDVDSNARSRSEFGDVACRNDAGKGKAAGDFTGGRRPVAVARESRDKARARARERTRDKLLKINTIGGNNNNKYNYSNNNYNSDLKMVDHVNPLLELELDYSLIMSQHQQQQQQGQFLGFPNQNYCPFANYTSDQNYCFGDCYYTIQEEQKPSLVVPKIPSYYYSYNSNNYSQSHHNPSISSSSVNNGLVFNMPQNPNDSSFSASLMSEDQEENFLSDSNIFRNLNF